jgi:CheY-like chemotaxis protein
VELQTSPTPHDALHHLRILLIEPDTDACSATARLLEGYGAQVVCAGTLEEARRKLPRHLDVIVCELPESGTCAELAHAVASDVGDPPPVVLFTAHPEQAEAAGVEAVVAKDAPLEALVEAIKMAAGAA